MHKLCKLMILIIVHIFHKKSAERKTKRKSACSISLSSNSSGEEAPSIFFEISSMFFNTTSLVTARYQVIAKFLNDTGALLRSGRFLVDRHNDCCMGNEKIRHLDQNKQTLHCKPLSVFMQWSPNLLFLARITRSLPDRKMYLVSASVTPFAWKAEYSSGT